jgi:hypothetical protein
MNPFIRIFSILAAFSLLLTQTSVANPAKGGTLSGRIFDSRTGEPLPGATVLLQDTQLGTSADIDGNYVLANIPPKTYNVVARLVGYEETTLYNVVIISGGATELNIGLKEAVTTLQDVVVTANPFAKSAESPLSVQKLSNVEIATYPGGNNDIAKVVQSLPGVAGSLLGFRNDVIIRGGGPSENVYYLDGVEIPNINHFATQGSAGGPVGLLNVSFFEGVTLNTSAFSAQYDNVLSGVLQFDQRSGNPRRYQGNVRVSASESALTVEGPLGKPKDGLPSDNTFIASVRRSYLQLLFQAIGLPFLPDYWDYQYRAEFKLDRKNTIMVTGIGSIDDFSVNPPDSYDPEQESILEQIPVIQQWTSSGGVSWRHQLDDKKGFITTTVSRTVLNNNFARYADNRTQTGRYFENNSRDGAFLLRSNATFFLGDWDLKTGILASSVHYTNRFDDDQNGFQYRTDLDFWRYGLFVETSRRLFSDRGTFSAGVRTDGNTFTSDGAKLLATLSPRAAFSYSLMEDGTLSLNLAAGRYYKLPPNTLLGFRDNTGLFANRNADYTRADHLTAGIDWRPFSAGKLTVEGFYKRYANYPVSLSRNVSLANLGSDFEVFGNEPVVTNGRGRTWGLETSYQQKLYKNFYLIAAHTWFKSEFAPGNGRYLSSLWDNRHLVSLTGGYKLPRNWEVAFRFRYAHETPFIPVDVAASESTYPAFVFQYDRINSSRLNSFNQTDIRIDRKWNFNGFSLQAFLEIQNVLNSNLPDAPRYGWDRDEAGIIQEPRRLVEIRSVDNSAVLPSFGFVVDF